MAATKSSFLDKVLGRIGRLDTEGLQTVVQRLARERSFLETLFNTIEDGVLVVDETGRVIYFNQAVTQLIGLQAGEEELHITKFLPEIDWQKISQTDRAGGARRSVSAHRRKLRSADRPQAGDNRDLAHAATPRQPRLAADDSG